MPVVGITGGIASGKSTFSRELLRRLPADFFDADACARELLATDGEIRSRVAQALNIELVSGDQGLFRAEIRDLVFSDPRKREALEAILHPEIGGRWMRDAGKRKGGAEWLYVDIPLLFETGAESYFDEIVVVGCTKSTQVERLQENRGLSGEIAQKIIATQLDLGLKINKADHLIWNESNLRTLEGQTALLVGWLKERYG